MIKNFQLAGDKTDNYTKIVESNDRSDVIPPPGYEKYDGPYHGYCVVYHDSLDVFESYHGEIEIAQYTISQNIENTIYKIGEIVYGGEFLGNKFISHTSRILSATSDEIVLEDLSQTHIEIRAPLEVLPLDFNRASFKIRSAYCNSYKIASTERTFNQNEYAFDYNFHLVNDGSILSGISCKVDCDVPFCLKGSFVNSCTLFHEDNRIYVLKLFEKNNQRFVKKIYVQVTESIDDYVKLAPEINIGSRLLIN